MQDKVKGFAKAIVGALIAGLGVVGAALGVGDVTAATWAAAALATLVAFEGVYWTSNGSAS